MTEVGLTPSTLAAWTTEVATQYSATLRESAPGEAEFTVDCQSNGQAAHKLLSDLQNRGYVHLADLTAYDEFPKSPRYHVVYELISLKDKKRCAVIAVVANENPAILTVTDMWKGADWLEREVYDMYGIRFDQHPDHRRILLPPLFVGHPLRKDFVVDYRQDYAKTLGEEGLFDPFGATVVKPTAKPTDKTTSKEENT